MSKRTWMIRAGEGGYLFDEFKSRSIISIGWNEVGDIGKLSDKTKIKDALVKCYPDYNPGKVNITAGQLYRFAMEIAVGDFVVTYDSKTRIYLVGTVKSNYVYKAATDYDHMHIINVKWSYEKSRDDLSATARNYLGAIMALFEIVGQTQDELLSKAGVKVENEASSETEEEEIKESLIEKAHEFIKDKVLALDWYDMQELVAGILRGMGYKTRVSPKGPDRGMDIMASPDGLGLESPRIIVEVKHRKGTMGSEKIRSFTGGLRGGDKGLYVSTGGFTQEAKYEAERSNIPVALVDSDELVRLIVQYYDHFDAETKALIPLKKIYWPV